MADADSARRPIEITDLLWSCDPVSGARLPVRQAAMVAQLEANGQARAARIARTIPARGGILDQDAVDALLVRVHCELQRLNEELQLPRRLAEALRGWLAPLVKERPGVPVRVVDVGCGLGFVIRWLSAFRALGPGVELVGVDLNRTLLDRAAELARAEGLDCRFIAADAFSPGVAVLDPTRTVVVSTGVMHHFDVGELPGFFAAQQRLGIHGFAHWDIDPSGWAVLGAWVFHQARMREPVSRHDGVLSARRAHPAAALLAAATEGAPGYRLRCADGPAWRPALSEVLRPIIGTTGYP